MNEDKFKNAPAPRNFHEVIGRVMLQVPCMPDAWQRLYERLEDLRNDSYYTAPEDMQRRWVELATLLTENLPWPPQEPWQIKISDIVTGKTPS